MTAYMGCIGADDFGTRLANECKSAGIAARPTTVTKVYDKSTSLAVSRFAHCCDSERFLVDKDAPTGTCAVTILDAERSLTTRLGAASKYKLDHVKDPETLNAFGAPSPCQPDSNMVSVETSRLSCIARHSMDQRTCAPHVSANKQLRS